MKTSVSILVSLFIFSLTLYSQEYTPLKSTRHYVYSLNTGDNLTLGIPDFAWDEKPAPGDEVGIFNSEGQLAGSGVYDGIHMAIAIWGDDETTKEKEGISSGEKYTLRLWHKASGLEDEMEVISWLEGNEIYRSNGISVINKIKLIPSSQLVKEYTLEACVPNPVKERSTIRFSLPKTTYVDITVYTATGEFVSKLLNEEKTAGSYSIDFYARELASGNYCYKMTTTDFTATRYMNLVK